MAPGSERGGEPGAARRRRGALSSEPVWIPVFTMRVCAYCTQGNFEDSREKIVRLLRAVWMRKRMERQRREWEERLERIRQRLDKC